MPEEQDAMGTSEKARPIHHIRASIHQRRQHFGEVRRIILQVCVLNENVVSSSLREARAKRRPLASILFVEDFLDARVVEGLKNFAGPVCGPVIDDDKLDVKATIQNAL